MNYRNKAINCVKDTILPMQRKQFEECGCCLDEQYKRYGNTEWLFAKTVERGHVYEIGYPACVCPDVVSGKVKDVSHCECEWKSEGRITLRMFTPERIVHYRKFVTR